MFKKMKDINGNKILVHDEKSWEEPKDFTPPRDKPHITRAWHELYINMQADPTITQTDKDFCEEIKLEYQTLASWKKKYRKYIFSEVEKARKTYFSELRTKNFKAIAKALDDSFNDRKLMAQLLGDLIERTESKTEIMDYDTKMRRTSFLLDAIEKKKKALEEAKQAENGTT